MLDLSARLALAERLARGSRWQRLLHAPGRYSLALGFRLVYSRTQRARPAVANTFFGLPMQVMLPSGTDLYLLGVKSHDSELRLARLLLRHLRPGATVVDIGAHYGYFTLLASQLVGPSGQVLAFEASPATYAVLHRNVQRYAQVYAQQLALAAQPGRVSFYEFPVMYNEFNSLDVAQFKQEKWYASFPPVQVEVPATTLDAVLAEAQPALIKIDVEGAEEQVIRGGSEGLRQQRPLVVLEYLAPSRHNASHRAAVALLRAWGYESFLPTATGELERCADLEGYLRAQDEDSANFVFAKP